MNKKKKIVVLSIIGILFAGILLIVYLSYKKTESEKDIVEEIEQTIPDQMSIVTEYDIFFSVVNNLNQYLNYLQSQDTTALSSILSPKLNMQNILNDFEIYNNNDISFKAKNMYYKNIENNYLFYVKGDIIENLYETTSIVKENTIFLVAVDYENLTYFVYPLEQEMTQNLPLIEEEIKILPNEYNKILGSEVITPNFICNLYLSDFYNTLMKDSSKSYEYLQKEFRIHNYPKKTDYLAFIEENQDKFSSQILECSLASNNQRIYKIKDLNYNTYTFTETSIMNYKVEWDLYEE